MILRGSKQQSAWNRSGSWPPSMSDGHPRKTMQQIEEVIVSPFWALASGGSGDNMHGGAGQRQSRAYHAWQVFPHIFVYGKPILYSGAWPGLVQREDKWTRFQWKTFLILFVFYSTYFFPYIWNTTKLDVSYLWAVWQHFFASSCWNTLTLWLTLQTGYQPGMKLKCASSQG